MTLSEQIRQFYELHTKTTHISVSAIVVVATIWFTSWRTIGAIVLGAVCLLSVLFLGVSLFFAWKEEDRSHRRIQLTSAICAALISVVAYALIPSSNEISVELDAETTEVGATKEPQSTESILEKSGEAAQAHITLLKAQAERAKRESEKAKLETELLKQQVATYESENAVYVDMISISSFEDDLARVEIELNSDVSLFGFINRSGQFAIQPKWSNAREFKDGFCEVEYGGKWGIINRSGRLVVDAAWDYVNEHHEG